MARPFSATEAKQLSTQYLKLKKSLNTIAAAEQKNISAVQTAAAAMAKRRATVLLKDIPVDELNREKRGIRIKLLRDNGYQTIEDVLRASLARIEAIDGIGREGARTIHAAAAAIAKEAESGVKLRLSTDDKSAEATALIVALYRYRCSEDIFSAHSALQTKAGKPGMQAHTALQTACGSLKWLFANKQKRANAEQAYKYLSALLNDDCLKSTVRAEKQLRRTAMIQPQEAWKAFESDPVPLITLLEQLVPQYAGSTESVYGLPEALAQSVAELPLDLNGLRCTLRRYQEWGVKYILHQGRVLLGDEMGLGKTMQAIAAMVCLRNAGKTHFLVVCPASVLSNWVREIQKHSDLRVTKIYGDKRNAALSEWIAGGGAAITTYETADFLSGNLKRSPNMLVVDEAHYVKNPEAKRTIHVKSIAAISERILFMTGTALENRVDEMIALFGILNPAVATEAKRIASLSSAPMFREKVAAVYYRRKRADVLTELPEKTESAEWCELGVNESTAYREAIISGNFPAARRVSWNVTDIADSCKARRMLEIIEEAEDDGRKVLVFSFFLDTIKKVCALLGGRCVQPITGAVAPERRQEIIDEFEKAPAGSVLAAQIVSGGTGLNIQTASIVILCEPQFKPSIENQAISRVYRMGQTRDVLVYRLLAEDTVDERIVEILRTKQQQFDVFADESAAAAETLELDRDTFASIMEDEKQRLSPPKDVHSR